MEELLKKMDTFDIILIGLLIVVVFNTVFCVTFRLLAFTCAWAFKSLLTVAVFNTVFCVTSRLLAFT